MSTSKGPFNYSASATVAEFRAAAAAVLAQGATGQSPKDTLLLHGPTGALGQVRQPDPAVAPAIYSLGVDLSQFVTDANLSGERGKAVKIAAAGVITLCTVDGEVALGNLEYVDSNAVGAPCMVRAMGEARILANGNLTRGWLLKVTTAGSYGHAAAGDVVVGQAIEDITGGQYGRALVNMTGYLTA